MPFRLRDLPALARIGLSFLLLVVLGGLAASAGHLVLHHENRDEQPGLSLDDIEGVYHGVSTTAALVGALERQHPPELVDADRAALLVWLRGDQIGESYDNLDLGEQAPAEILDRTCMECHARSAPTPAEPPLEFWDDVRKVAFSREVAPLPTEIVVASLHTHAISMGVLSIVLGILALCTRWWPGLVGVLTLVSGLALTADLGCWLLARDAAALVPVIAVAGGLWMVSSTLLALLALAELWWPR